MAERYIGRNGARARARREGSAPGGRSLAEEVEGIQPSPLSPV